MPGMDGFQVMEALKTNDADAYLPVLVVTAQPGHKLRALQGGARDFISKPFDLLEVKVRIRNMLEVRLLYKELKRFNKTLEQMVRERTAELLSLIHIFLCASQHSATKGTALDQAARPLCFSESRRPRYGDCSGHSNVRHRTDRLS